MLCGLGCVSHREHMGEWRAEVTKRGKAVLQAHPTEGTTIVVREKA